MLPALHISRQDFDRAKVPTPAGASRICLPEEHEAVVFFTSGSTGEPVPHGKTWAQLTGAADAMSGLLAIGTEAPVLAGTVSHSHMFGFEMLVMQVLRGAASVYSLRIVYPSDLAAFAQRGYDSKWLVTTPFHLGIFAKAGMPARGIERVVSATMPLDALTARQVEAASGAQVSEIYGSTETGCLAHRRTATDAAFYTTPGTLIQIGPEGTTYVWAPHLGERVVLRDLLEASGDGFLIRGRDTDIVKVAGKRASLEALTRTLQSISGIEDGCFIDATRQGQTRLAAFAVAPLLTREDIREALAARMDAAFLPRPLMLVERLPRDANGKVRLAVLERLLSRAGDRSSAAASDT